MMQMKNSSCLFVHRILKGIADATIKVFVPLLILKITQNLQYSFIYATADFLLTSIFFFALKGIIKKFPFISLIVSVVPLIVMQFLLTINISLPLIFGLAFLSALSTTAYYGALNLIFGFVDKDANAAKLETGKNIGQIIFTLLSAYILGELSNSLIFVVIFSSAMYICSVVPLIVKYKQLKAEIKDLPKVSNFEVIKNNKLFNFFHLLTGSASFVVETFIPLYLYSKGLSFTVVSIVMALQYLFCIAGSYLSSFLHKKGWGMFSILLNCAIFIAGFAVVMLVENMYVCYGAVFLLSFAHYMTYVPFFAKFTKTQIQKNYFQDAIFYRDVFQNGARAMGGGLFLMFPYFAVMFGLGFASTVGLGLVGSLLSKK